MTEACTSSPIDYSRLARPLIKSQIQAAILIYGVEADYFPHVQHNSVYDEIYPEHTHEETLSKRIKILPWQPVEGYDIPNYVSNIDKLDEEFIIFCIEEDLHELDKLKLRFPSYDEPSGDSEEDPYTAGYCGGLGQLGVNFDLHTTLYTPPDQLSVNFSLVSTSVKTLSVQVTNSISQHSTSSISYSYYVKVI